MKHTEPLHSVSRETNARLEVFAGLLRRWSAKINLVSRSDLDLLWPRHIADSLQLLPHLGRPSRAIDLGSGAGFPGLVLCIASQIPFDLVEADQRKAAFLREAARETGAPATIHATRIEAAALPPAPLVTARALAPLTALLRFAAPLLTENGRCLFLKGRQADAELTAARQEWNMDVTSLPSQTESGAQLLLIQNPRLIRG